MEDDDETVTFDELVDTYADGFETLDTTDRVRSLSFVNTLTLDKEMNARDALKMLAVIEQVVHQLIEEHTEHDDSMTDLENVLRHQIGIVINVAWCGNIEPTFIKPLMCALAVEIRDWD